METEEDKTDTYEEREKERQGETDRDIGRLAQRGVKYGIDKLEQRGTDRE